METVLIDASHVTFGTKDRNFAAANNKLSTDVIATANRNLVVDSSSDSYHYLSLPAYYSISGQYVSNYEVLDYAVYQSVFKFDIPIGKIKAINSAKVRFQKTRVFNLAHYSDEAQDNSFNIRLATEFKRYPPNLVSTLPTIGTFSESGNFDDILIPNAANYIDGPYFHLIFSEINQENNLQNVSNPVSGDSNIIATAFYQVKLFLEYEPLEIIQGTGFRHLEVKDSGLIERPGNGLEAVYPSSSGFVRVTEKEDLGCVIFFPGSGHQLKKFAISCNQRVLEFPDVEAIKDVELVIPANLQGSGLIDVYRWNTEPNPSDLNFTLIGTLPAQGGLITLNVEPYKRWFHFGQYNSVYRAVRPIRLDELSGKLVSIGF